MLKTYWVKPSLINKIKRYSTALTLGASLSFGLSFASVTPGSSAEIKGFLELYTSQGCSSCPAADRLFETYTNRDDLIALSFSVDYWDYLGWKDTFATKINTVRQVAYKQKMALGYVYTPQVVINGLTHTKGFDKGLIDGELKSFAQKPLPIKVSLSDGKDGLKFSIINIDNTDISEATIWLALFSKSKKVNVHRGENHGRKLVYHNVVRKLTPVGKWMGKKLEIMLPKEEMADHDADGCVVFLQAGKGGQILGAAQVKNWSKITP